MKRARKTITASLFGLVLFLCFARAQAAPPATPREELKILTADLQKKPSDSALRERIIKLAAKLKPAPAVPEEARRPFVRGHTAFADAKAPAEFSRAALLFEEASNLAPWWADPYFNLAKAREGMQDYSGAIRSLEFYLKTPVGAEEKRQAQDLIYALEEKRDSKNASDAAAASADRFLGTWSRMVNSASRPYKQSLMVERNGGSFKISGINVGLISPYDITIEGGVLMFTLDYSVPTSNGMVTYGRGQYRGTLSGGDRTLSFTFILLPPRPGELELQQTWSTPSDAFGNNLAWTKE